MMVDLKVMAYFKLSLSTRNWDSAFFMAVFHRKPDWPGLSRSLSIRLPAGLSAGALLQ
ncbi:hypothetical protein [Aeromonas molluscorum]|uniref:hypothetical protein n=1 Tax=Aeromonas molluscorum TaxID=271417 RepID=UPI003F1BADE7